MKNEAARLAHKNYYDRSRKALECGYYLEALCLEYSEMESRVASIMRMIKMPCFDLNNEKTHSIGIHVKLNCLKNCLGENNVFNKSLLTKQIIRKMVGWKAKRNKIIHRLYANPEEYGETILACKKIAEEGFVYVDLLFKEANRIRYISKHHPDAINGFLIKCPKKSKTCEEFLENNSQM